MRVDLHTHTRASDGTQSPEELVAAAAAAGLDVLGLTDHDTADGWAAAERAADAAGIALVRGMEISTRLDGRGAKTQALQSIRCRRTEGSAPRQQRPCIRSNQKELRSLGLFLAVDQGANVRHVVAGSVRRKFYGGQMQLHFVAADAEHLGGLLGGDELRNHLERVRLWPCWDTLFAKKRRRAVRTRCETGTQSRPESFCNASNIDSGMRALIEVVSSFMWATMGHNGAWGQDLM